MPKRTTTPTPPLPTQQPAGHAKTVGHAGPITNRVRDANALHRARESYRLWLRGYSFGRIADELGYHDESGAYKAWQRARKLMISSPDLEAERERERTRLELAYAGIAERVESGDDWAIDRFLGIAERKAKLLGLDLPSGDALAASSFVKRVTIVDADPVPPVLVGAAPAESEGSE